MSELMDSILREARALPLVPLKAITAYEAALPELTRCVDDALAAVPGISGLIGNNPLQVMYDNHRHHGAFMAAVFSVGDYELLARTVPWVYRAYHAHGFSYEYFPLELGVWARAIEGHLADAPIEAITAIYQWLAARHEQMITLAESETGDAMPISEQWLEMKNSFYAALMAGDHGRCLAAASGFIRTATDVEHFYLHIIQPVMYEVGMEWERGNISVAQEHLASAIVSRVMAAVYLVKTGYVPHRGKAVIAAAPNEFHEIGAWMVSDLLEFDGWEVRYLGANVPGRDLTDLLGTFLPDVLAMSVTMPFNLMKVKEIIEAMRSDPVLARVKVMVGGRAFNENPGLRLSLGADGFAANALDAKLLARQWGRRESHGA